MRHRSPAPKACTPGRGPTGAAQRGRFVIARAYPGRVAESSAGRRPGVWPALGIGVVAVGLTLAVAELAATTGAWLRALDGTASPVRALGAAFIAITPEWLKDIGISAFGQHDKVALAVAMVVTFVIVGVVIGVIGRINRFVAAALGVLLVAVTALAVVTRPDAGAGDAVPTVIGGAAGTWFLLRVFWPPDDAPAEAAGASEASIAAFDRRQLLRLGGIGAGLAFVAGALSRLVPDVVDLRADRATVTLPALGRARIPATVNPPVPGLTPYLTANDDFYRVDTAFTVPRVTTADWRLVIHGLVDEPFTVTWAELVAMPQVERVITLTCVSNEVGGDLAGNAVWQGVPLADLLERAKPQPGADCLYSTSADHFSVATPLEAVTADRDALLAIGMNGSPLPIDHGYPARLVVPGLYGYVSATKWVVDLEVTRFSEVTGYWTDRGWSAKGPIKIASRIDTPQYDVTVPTGVVPVAGVAWAQPKGISAVQLRVDDGPWRDAELAGTVSGNTWRQWVFRWDTTGVSSGKHRLRCRAIDGTGAVQDPTPAPPAPNGSSGYDEVSVVIA